MTDLALFIDSYDGNEDIWDTFFKVHSVFWPDCCFQRYLITNNKSYDTDNLKVIKTGNERNWFVMTIKGLEEINNKYVFFMLEDQLLGQKMNNKDIIQIVDRMDQEDIYYYRMTCPRRLGCGKSFVEVPENTPYPISLQPAIWNRRVFLEYLRELKNKGCKSPWDFERFFIDKYKNGDSKRYIKGIRYDSRNLMYYQNILIQGKWDPRVVKYYKKKNIIIDIGDRKFMPPKAVYLDQLKRNRIVRSLDYTKQAKIKAILKKMGCKFIT